MYGGNINRKSYKCMIPVVKNNLEQIIETCKKMQVKSLYLFGSAAREDHFTKESDLDFLFQFKIKPEDFSGSTFDYFDLLFRLEEITGKKVDLVAEEKIINKYFLKRINSEKVKIYES
jgi:predicted nucleotidyltransferase